MSLADSAREIISLFDRELSLSENLLQIMKNEQAALSKNDVSALETSITEKDKLLKEISSTETNITVILQSFGLSLNNESLKKLQAHCSSDDKQTFVSLFEKLRNVSAMCYEQNLVNSKIIEVSANNIRKLVDALNGQQPDQPELYDLSGKSSRKSRSQVLGRV